MKIEQSRLSKIIMEEYQRAIKTKKEVLKEGTYNNPIKLDPNMIREMIIEETRNASLSMNESYNYPIKLDSNTLRRIIMEESRKLGRR